MHSSLQLFDSVPEPLEEGSAGKRKGDTSRIRALGGGDKEARAKATKKFGKSNYGADSEDHEQEILTPLWILDDVVRPAFKGRIMLDPCASTGDKPDGNGGLTVRSRNAELNIYEPLKPGDPSGLDVPWADRTFVNPPYNNLKEWLAKLAKELEVGKRIIMLIPVRTNRTWWFEAMSRADDIVCLNPFPFVGSKSAFPAPVCLVGFETGDLNVPTARVAGRLVGMTADRALSAQMGFFEDDE
jgi:DNA N-6-adenine-methyltransferase (Dam)